MPMGTDRSLADDRSIEAALERLRRDLFDSSDTTTSKPEPAAPIAAAQAGPEPDAPSAQARTAARANSEGPEPIDYASLEFEVERMRKRLAIWEIFMAYIRDGARSWPEVQRSLTSEDFTKIVAICDGVPLRDLLLDMR